MIKDGMTLAVALYLHGLHSLLRYIHSLKIHWEWLN